MMWLLFLIGNSAYANELSLGVGGSFSQHSLENSQNNTNAIYRGPGAVFDFRYRMHPDRLSTTLGVDLFAVVDLDWQSNTNTNAAESLSLTGYGAGLDVRLNWFFLGGQYRIVGTDIRSSSSSVHLTYGSIGLRGGVNIPISDEFEASLYGIYSNDIASARENNLSAPQPVQALKGILQIRYTLIKGWFD